MMKNWKQSMVLLVVVLALMIVSVGTAGAQDGVTGEPAPGFDLGEWISQNDVVIAVVVIAALLVGILRPAINRLVDGLAASVPEGFAKDAVMSVKDAVSGALERYIEARQADAALTPSPLDDAAWKSLQEQLDELNARLDDLLKAQSAQPVG
jgi:hypothetical protein